MSIPWRQSLVLDFFPPTPQFTEKNIPELSEQVYVVTGGASGIGFELCKILYSKGATAYILGRSEQNGNKAIEQIKEQVPESKGALRFIHCDVADFPTIKVAASQFLKEADRLDGLYHNAGLMAPPRGTESKQGYEIQLATHAMGPFLLQKFLTPLMLETVKKRPKNAVRAIWVSSAAHNLAPKGGINWNDINFKKKPAFGTEYFSRFVVYGQSKAASIILGSELARRYEDQGLISMSVNPGYLRSNLQRHSGGAFQLMAKLFQDAYHGCLTYLYAGFSPDIDASKHGSFIVPFGRFGPMRTDLCRNDESALENRKRFWDWCEKETEPYT